jgi:hypothetical protein
MARIADSEGSARRVSDLGYPTTPDRWGSGWNRSSATEAPRRLSLATTGFAARGARILVVNSGNHRVDAHAFYENLGYRFTGRRYKKLRS